MNREKRQLYLHSIMCLVGGFMGAYAVLGSAHMLGSAQTNNLIEIVVCLLGGNLWECLLHFCGLLLYVLGIFLCTLIQKRTPVNSQRYAILVDLLGLALLCFLPPGLNLILYLLPLFFMMATQWTAFHGIGEYNSSTIFSTNNLKQMTVSLAEYYLEGKTDIQKLRRGKFFANSLLWYHIGVAFSFFAHMVLGRFSTLLCIPVVLIALLLTRPTSFQKTVESISPL